MVRLAMAKKTEAEEPAKIKQNSQVLRLPAEVTYAEELEALRQTEADKPPSSWKLSPRSVLAYIIGGKTVEATIDGKKKKVDITRKFYGDTAIVERSIVTLASERALLLVGDLLPRSAGIQAWSFREPPAPRKNISSIPGTSPASLPKGPTQAT
jgi:hypothetical protein